jgi:hypothetical protein
MMVDRRSGGRAFRNAASPHKSSPYFIALQNPSIAGDAHGVSKALSFACGKL